jgi:hypothetical protein
MSYGNLTFYDTYQVSKFGAKVKFISEVYNVDINTAATDKKRRLWLCQDNQRLMACRKADKILL